MHGKLERLHFHFYFSFEGAFNTTMISLVLVGYEMILANLALGALLAVFYLISRMCLWNNGYIFKMRTA